MIDESIFAAQIIRIINKLIFLEKKSIFKYEGLKLYPSELHLMGVIEANKGINATKMAVELGITKGAVSQTLTRLEKKGILYKTKDHRNKNELTAHFTELGKDVLENHFISRLSFQKEYEQYLTTLTNKEKKVISQFLSNIEGFVDRLV